MCTLPDGTAIELVDGATGLDAAQAIGPRLAQAAVAVEVGGELRDLRLPLADGDSVRVLTARDPEALAVLRHSTAHVMAEAVLHLWPDTKVAIGPAIADGFYYDFDFPEPVSADDLDRIDAEMRRILKTEHPFVRTDGVDKHELERRFADEHQPYKLELVEALPEGDISLYTQDGFEDLCRGPHLQTTKPIKAFKLQSLAGAYWRGDSDKPMLTRIYGTAFFDQAGLDEYLHRLEEAQKRDHRRIGRELDLFHFEDVSPGSPFWHPKGMVIWNELTELWRTLNLERGYQEVRTPIIFNVDVWKKSGHWEAYRENMYFTEVENGEFGLKPMNCPGHIFIFDDALRSYRDLPMRLSEQGLVHRHEPSGTLHGLTRVRHITQDDAHIFCSHDQIEDEVIGCLELAGAIYDTFGLDMRSGALHPSGQADRLRRPVGRRRGRVAAGAGTGRGGIRPERGRRRVLRPQDRSAHVRLDRTFVADGHHPARLPDARAIRDLLHRQRQQRASPGDDPPRTVRLVRAVHRHLDRALRRCLPAVAGAGAGDGAGRGRPPRRVRQPRRRDADRTRPSGRDRRARRVDGPKDRRRRASAHPLHPGRRRP